MEKQIITIEKLNKLIEHREGEKYINLAKAHEERVRVHTEATLRKEEFTKAHNEFFSWVDAIIDDETKSKRLKQLCILPFPTVDIANAVFDEYKRALNASNKYTKFEFKNDATLETDFEAYASAIGIEDFFQNKGIETLKKYFNSYVVCDLPTEPTLDDPRPQPYFNILKICDIVAVDSEEDGSVDWILFKQDVHGIEKETIEDRVCYMDVFYQCTLIKLKGQSKYVFEIEPKEHGVLVENRPFCPAFKFWSKLVSERNEVNSECPITNSLGKFDKYVFDYLSKEYAKLYASFPIYWGYKNKCDYHEELNGSEAFCENGRLTWMNATADGYEPVHKACPKCSAKKLIGAGTFIEVDPPQTRDDWDGREPVGRLSGDVETLKALEEDLKALEYKIHYDTTGHTPEMSSDKQAFNEDQVATQLNTQVNILDGIKTQFELTMWRLYSVLGSLRYGEQFKGVSLSLGTEYFLKSAEQVNKDYQDAKMSGRPPYELARKREVMYRTELQNNPYELNRLDIMQNLDPYPDNSPSEIKALGFDISDPVGFLIKLKFNNFIMRFERENNTSILNFGSAISFDAKIKAIQEQLIKYANEQLSENTGQVSTQQQSQGSNLQSNNGTPPN